VKISGRFGLARVEEIAARSVGRTNVNEARAKNKFAFLAFGRSNRDFLNFRALRFGFVTAALPLVALILLLPVRSRFFQLWILMNYSMPTGEFSNKIK
jgi:hypothetical protein